MEENEENKNLEKQDASEAPQESATKAKENVSMDQTEDDDPIEEVTLNSHALRYGLFLGLAGIIITVLLYMVSPAMLASPWMALLLVVYFVYLIFVGINYRNQIGGYIDFGKAFKHSFIVIVVSGLLGIVFNMLLYNVIDPNLPEVLADASAETARSMAERFGAPEDTIDEAVATTRTDTLKGFTVMGQLRAFGIGLIFYAIVSSIVGLIVRKRVPEGDVV